MLGDYNAAGLGRYIALIHTKGGQKKQCESRADCCCWGHPNGMERVGKTSAKTKQHTLFKGGSFRSMLYRAPRWIFNVFRL